MRKIQTLFVVLTLLLSACNSTPEVFSEPTDLDRVFAGTHPDLIEALSDPYPVYDPDFSILSVERIETKMSESYWLLVTVEARNLVTGTMVKDSVRVLISPDHIVEDRGEGTKVYTYSVEDHFDRAKIVVDVDNVNWRDWVDAGWTLEG